MPNSDQLMTTDEVAAAYRVHAETVRRWARSGHIPSVKVGRNRRYRRSDVDAYVNSQIEPVAS